MKDPLICKRLYERNFHVKYENKSTSADFSWSLFYAAEKNSEQVY